MVTSRDVGRLMGGRLLCLIRLHAWVRSHVLVSFERCARGCGAARGYIR